MELAGDRPGLDKAEGLCSLRGWRGETRMASWQRWTWPAPLTEAPSHLVAWPACLT